MVEPRPRRTVRGSMTGRPVMALLDLLGRRWALRVIWELRDGWLTSRQLREACDDVSPTVLQARLSELRAAGLIALQHRHGYELTPLGRELLDQFLPINAFAERWAAETLPEKG
jgi:DNA-binding HxlR family transcriptional regulator